MKQIPSEAKSLIHTKHQISTCNNILCTVSGGADSDIMIDIVNKLDDNKKIKYVFFDTGLEYAATKRHLDYLEERYNIKIERVKPEIPLPLAVKRYGIPFISKNFSEMIGRLQKHGFDFSSDGVLDFNECLDKFPKAKCSVKWWNNCNGTNSKGVVDSRFNIKGKSFLKEFMIQNPPNFKVSKKCCQYAKKDVAKKFLSENEVDLNVHGVRKSEGGIRATAYKNCFTSNTNHGYDEYRPLFFFTDADKQYYKDFFNIKYSDCYEVWGMKRTGCVGCPYSLRLEEDLEKTKVYEPNMYNACINIFGESYEYTKAYRKFKEEMKSKEKQK